MTIEIFIILVLYLMIILYMSYEDYEFLLKGKMPTGDELDEFQMKKLHQGIAYTLILIKICFIMLVVFLFLKNPIPWDIILVMVLMNTVINTFYDVWKIMNHCNYGRQSKDLRGLRSDLLGMMFCLFMAYLNYSLNVYVSILYETFAVHGLIKAVAKYTRYRIDQKEQTED